jgi:DNA repair exonuclease SbcCD nuclease subunit
MSLIRFSSDYHLGVNRVAHTTPQSRVALREAVFAQAMIVLEPDMTHHIHLGDLFDKFSNNEDVIRQGAEVCRKCCSVMSGNHDMSNRDTARGSFELLHSLGGFNTVTETSVKYPMDGATVVFEPHCLTQEEFVSRLKEWQWEEKSNRTRFLLLHCNYDSKFPQKDSTLVLERDMAEKLLEVFDYILIGHEHNSRTDFDGRVVCVGNIFPTSFGDISDKYVWEWDGEELKKRLVWSMEQHYWECDWTYLLSIIETMIKDGEVREFPTLFGGITNFIRITGTAPATKMPEISKAINKLWELVPSALMIGNFVQAEELHIEAVNPTEGKAIDVVGQISYELAGTVLHDRWASYIRS